MFLALQEQYKKMFKEIYRDWLMEILAERLKEGEIGNIKRIATYQFDIIKEFAYELYPMNDKWGWQRTKDNIIYHLNTLLESNASIPDCEIELSFYHEGSFNIDIVYIEDIPF